MIALSIDPGSRGCGCALWCDGKLAAAGFAKSAAPKGSGPRECAQAAQAAVQWLFDRGVTKVDRLVVEWPQIYERSGSKTKGDPNDLLPLTAINGALAALLPDAEVHYFVPYDWKQRTRKPESTKYPYVIRLRVERRLDADELATVDWTNNVKHSWDVTDAIGIGLYHHKRFERHRVYTRE